MMKKTWKVVGIIALIIILLGALCIAVGFLTGAESGRILSVLNTDYGLSDTVSSFLGYIGAIRQSIAAAH